MNTLVLGAGAMGCLFGGKLSLSGVPVTLVDVWREHIDAINSKGLQLHTNSGHHAVPVQAREAAEVQGPIDLLIVFTKTLHSAQALETVAHLVSEQTHVLTLQNGLGNVEKIERFVPRQRILLGVTNYPCDLEGPGQVSSLGSGAVRLYSADGSASPMLDQVNMLLNKADFNCQLDPEIERAIWEKVALNSAINAVTAVSRLPIGPVGDSKEGRELVLKIISEVCSVARATDIAIDEQSIRDTIIDAFDDHRDHMPSMLQDLNAGRATEVGGINGAVLDVAERLDMEIPVTRTLYQLVRTIERAGTGRAGSR